MASWGKKLEGKLSALSETSSKESIQTLAKWIGFNRKHGPALAEVLRNRLEDSAGGRHSVLATLSVISQVLLLNKEDPLKWDKCLDFRVLIGESVLVPTSKSLDSDKLSPFLKEWDEANVFGGPTLLNQLRRDSSTTATTSSPQKKDAPPTQPVLPPEEPPFPKETTPEAEKPAESKPTVVLESTSANVEESKEKDEEDENDAASMEGSPKPQEQEPEKSATTNQSSESTSKPSGVSVTPQQAYDFESKGISEAAVQMKDLQEPCRAVATLQIARDLRNDSAVQLSSLLSELPLVVRQYMDQVKELGAEQAKIQLEDDQARDLSLQTNELAIDLDVQEQLGNVRMFRELIEKQRQARQLLILLLIKSRCKFGSAEAAEAFEQSQRAIAELSRRKQVLLDAMDLEGLELNAKDKKLSDAADQELKDDLKLDWYNINNMPLQEEPLSKKARMEE